MLKKDCGLPKPPDIEAPLSDWALWHWEHGNTTGAYGITPLRPGEKKPYLPDWPQNPFKTRSAVIKHWKRHPDDNIGLVPQPGFFWLDADNVELLDDAEDNHGRLPATYSQRSINGSFHFLFKGDISGSPAVSYDGERLGEVRGASSGQCVGAGSRGTTKGGKPGRWAIEELVDIAVSPKWLTRMIGISKKQSAKPSPPSNNDRLRKDYGKASPWDYEQAERLVSFVMDGELIKDYEGAFLEGERNNLTFHLFAEAMNRMVHPDAILSAVFDSGIDGGLDDGEVSTGMWSAYYANNAQGTYGSKVQSYWLPNHVFKIHEEGKKPRYKSEDPSAWKSRNEARLPTAFLGDPDFQERIRDIAPSGLLESMRSALGADDASFPPLPLFSVSELSDLPEPEWDIANLIGRAKMGAIVGKWGQYKTFIALDMALAMAGGVPWPRVTGADCKTYTVPSVRRVLYIAAEGGGAEYNARIEAILENRKKIDPETIEKNFVLAAASAPLDTLAGQAAIADAIERATEKLGGSPEVIFLDTLAKSMTGEENSNTDMGKVQRVAAAIQHHLNCTLAFVHHTGKNDNDKEGRGASSFPAGLDFLFHVKGDTTTKVAELNVEKQKDTAAEKNIILRGRVIGSSLAFARIASKPSNKAEEDTAVYLPVLTAFLDNHRGKPVSTLHLARVLAKRAFVDFEDMDDLEQKRVADKLRGWIKRHLVNANTGTASDFKDRYQMPDGKWMRNGG